jgi:hypothetical protein
MELILVTGGIIILAIAAYFFLTVSVITKAKNQIIAKQDAIMAKLIEIKHR